MLIAQERLPMPIRFHAAIHAREIILSRFDSRAQAESLSQYFRDNGVPVAMETITDSGECRLTLTGITENVFDWLMSRGDVELI